jgi:hypothetical protein
VNFFAERGKCRKSSRSPCEPSVRWRTAERVNRAAAWGKTHDDATIWSMVAFLQMLPTLTPEQYAAMTQDSESSHEGSGHGHMHDAEKADSDNIESKTKDHGLDEGDDHRH